MPVKLARTLPLLFLVVSAHADERYERYRQPDKIMAKLALVPGERVADIGAGGGFLTLRIADVVGPSGRVVATEIDDEAIALLTQRAAGKANVTVRKVAADDPGLEPAGYDLILLSEVDQYLPDRVAYLTKVRPALRPGGRIVVTNRKNFRAALVDAATRAGYAILRESDDLPAHFFIVLVHT